MRADDLYQLPSDLPVPVDDGAARHLAGLALPPVPLPSTSGGTVRLDDPGISLAVIYCYPRTGRPEADALGGKNVGTRYPAPADVRRNLVPTAAFITSCRISVRPFTV